jgi:ankyrin repeat protein
VNAPEAFYNRTALHGAAWFNHHEIVQMLIENGADLNPHSTWADGETPLHFAARNGSAEAIQVLIDADADLDVQTEVGRTPLMSVLISNPPSNLPEIVTLLLDGGANPNLQDGDGNTALHYASRRGSSLGVRVEAIAILIEHGAALDLENDEGQTAVDVAATEEMAEMLRAAGAVEQEALDLEGLNLAELDSLLLEAVRSDDLGAIEQLLDAGADSDARSSMGVPILMLAAFKNNLDMVRLLVEHGADVNVQTGSGPRFGELRGSPLTAAAKFGSPEMIELLLDAGADANASTWAESGEASEALFAAAEENHAEIIELLLAHGAVVDGTNLGGRSPLIHSAYFNSPDVIRVLLTHGADIDLQDVTGYTALHWAATDGNLEAAQVLIENGAALDIETNMGQTPLEIRSCCVRPGLMNRSTENGQMK